MGVGVLVLKMADLVSHGLVSGLRGHRFACLPRPFTSSPLPSPTLGAILNNTPRDPQLFGILFSICWGSPPADLHRLRISVLLDRHRIACRDGTRNRAMLSNIANSHCTDQRLASNKSSYPGPSCPPHPTQASECALLRATCSATFAARRCARSRRCRRAARAVLQMRPVPVGSVRIGSCKLQPVVARLAAPVDTPTDDMPPRLCSKDWSESLHCPVRNAINARFDPGDPSWGIRVDCHIERIEGAA